LYCVHLNFIKKSKRSLKKLNTFVQYVAAWLNV